MRKVNVEVQVGVRWTPYRKYLGATSKERRALYGEAVREIEARLGLLSTGPCPRGFLEVDSDGLSKPAQVRACLDDALRRIEGVGSRIEAGKRLKRASVAYHFCDGRVFQRHEFEARLDRRRWKRKSTVVGRLTARFFFVIVSVNPVRTD